MMIPGCEESIGLQAVKQNYSRRVIRGCAAAVQLNSNWADSAR